MSVEAILVIDKTMGHFESVPCGGEKRIPFILRNVSTLLLGIRAVEVSGQGFSLGFYGCGAGLPPGGVCVVETVFRPIRQGLTVGLLTVQPEHANVPSATLHGSVVSATLTGTGVATGPGTDPSGGGTAGCPQ
jgi:hypothetical protein